MKAWRSNVSATARRNSALSNGGTARLTSRVRGTFAGITWQTAWGAWLSTSFSKGIETPKIVSNLPVTKPRILVEMLGTIVYSIPSRYGRSGFQ